MLGLYLYYTAYSYICMIIEVSKYSLCSLLDNMVMLNMYRSFIEVFPLVGFLSSSCIQLAAVGSQPKQQLPLPQGLTGCIESERKGEHIGYNLTWYMLLES